MGTDDSYRPSMADDPYGARAPLPGGGPDLIRLERLSELGVGDLSRLPHTVKILLENLLRHAGGQHVSEADVEALARYPERAPSGTSVPFQPARVVLQDFTGVPAVVDLAAMRAAMARAGRRRRARRSARAVRPRDRPLGAGRRVRLATSRTPATSTASTSATASATSCCAGRRARSTASASCRPAWASSTRSTSSTSDASCSCARTGRLAIPDTLVGTDSHTTMINGARRASASASAASRPRP